MTLFLKSARIINFKSLADVTLNFRDLTILIGANASGKSNCLEALDMLRMILDDDSPPHPDYINILLRKNTRENLKLVMNINDLDDTYSSQYSLVIGTKKQEFIFLQEKLYINQVNVINIENGVGKVCDEDGENYQAYSSKPTNLALKSAGKYGNKPVTSRILEFINNWKFYDLEPRKIREHSRFNRPLIKNTIAQKEIPILQIYGSEIEDILVYWFENYQDKINEINRNLSKYLYINLKLVKEDSQSVIVVQEQGKLEVPLANMSDGTLRIIAYYVLLYDDNLPPLIGIEEPERNLHPALFLPLARVLQKLSMKTQLIITTHSSQLLDCFTLEEIQDDVMVLCLSKKDDKGTQVFALDELGEKREDLKDWMQDFGVGSAVYNSNLLEECLEEQYA